MPADSLPNQVLPPSSNAFLHIDETLANSSLQWLVWLGVASGVLLLIVGLDLHLSYQVGLGVLLLIGLALSQILPYHLVAISSLPLPYQAKNNSLGEVEWQLGITQIDIANFFRPNQQQPQLWQARLSKAKLYNWVIVLTFWVDEPHERPLTLTIWQDQVSADSWRQLCVLSHL